LSNDAKNSRIANFPRTRRKILSKKHKGKRKSKIQKQKRAKLLEICKICSNLIPSDKQLALQHLIQCQKSNKFENDIDMDYKVYLKSSRKDDVNNPRRSRRKQKRKRYNYLSNDEDSEDSDNFNKKKKQRSSKIG
jgi:hypothetical protein